MMSTAAALPTIVPQFILLAELSKQIGQAFTSNTNWRNSLSIVAVRRILGSSTR